MGQRSRKRRGGTTLSGARKPAAGESGGDRLTRGYARGRARDDEIRASLEPLGEGERPGAVTVAAIIAVVLAIANAAMLAAGVQVSGEKTSAVGVLFFSALMIAAAVGMWQARYWAVLGFQALLGISLVVAGLSLAVASNVAALVLCLAILGPGGYLFWKLIRAMARIQMPERRPSDPDRPLG